MSVSFESIFDTSVHDVAQISPSLHRLVTSRGRTVVVKTLQTHALNSQELQELLEEVKALWMPNRHNNIVWLFAALDPFFHCNILSMSEQSKCLFWIRTHCCPPRLAACTSSWNTSTLVSSVMPRILHPASESCLQEAYWTSSSEIAFNLCHPSCRLLLSAP